MTYRELITELFFIFSPKSTAKVYFLFLSKCADPENIQNDKFAALPPTIQGEDAI